MRKILYIIKITIISFFEFILDLLPDGSYGDVVRGYFIKCRVKKCGKNLKVSKHVRLRNDKNITIGDNVYIGYGCWMEARFGIAIESDVMFGPYVVLASGNHKFSTDNMSFYGESIGGLITIGRGSWLAAHSVVTHTGRVGECCLLGANSVVTKKFEDNSKIIKFNDRISNVYER